MTVAMVALALIACFAFAIEAAIGFGSTVITATVGAALVPLAVLLPAFIPINLALSAILLARGHRHVAWRVLLVEIAPPVAVGAAVGMAIRGGAWLQPAFAVFVIALAVMQLVRPATRPLAHGPRLAVLVLGGLAHGLFGTGGPLVVYAARRRLADPTALRSTLAVLWLALNTALVASFAYTWQIARTSGVVAFALPVGLVIGERWHRRLDERVVWIVLLVAGVLLLGYI
jgi:uncharacterized protein